MADVEALIAEAETLGLFRPHTAFEVHCANCHGRLNARGDCDTCGLIGRSAAEARRRASGDATAEQWLASAIAKRKAYRPSGKAARAEESSGGERAPRAEES